MNKFKFNTIIIVLINCLLVFACGTQNADVEQGLCTLSELRGFEGLSQFQDFGCEEGYFIYMADMEKVPWTRNRNFVSIEFYEELEEEKLKEILDDYDLFYHSRVLPTKHVFARVKSRPAEVYYTTYGDTTVSVLGNLQEVKYALPVFMNEFWQPMMLNDRIILTFNEGFNEEQELAILDSLKSNDHLTRLPFVDPPYLLQTSKATPKDPLSLVNHYMETMDAIWSADPNIAFMID